MCRSACLSALGLTWASVIVLSGIIPVSAGDTPAVSPPAERLAFLIESGERALDGERFGEAIEYLSEALRLDWNNPHVFDLLQQARSERAQDLAEWEHQMRLAEYRRDWSGAVTRLERIVAEDTTRTDLIVRLSYLTRRQRTEPLIHSGLEKFILGDYAASLADFESALVIDPTDSTLTVFRDRARERTGDGSMADLQSDPDIWPKYLAALEKFRAGDLTAANRLWTEVQAKYPSNPMVRSNLEQVRRRLAQGDVAARE